MIYQMMNNANNGKVDINDYKTIINKSLPTGTHVNNDKTTKINNDRIFTLIKEPMPTVYKTTSGNKSFPTSSLPSNQPSMSELAAANGAPGYLVEKVRQLEKEYAAQGKVLTFDEVIRLAKERGIPDVVIDQIKDIYKNGNNSGNNFDNITNTNNSPVTSSNRDTSSIEKINDSVKPNPMTSSTTVTTKNNKKPSIADIAAANGAPPALVDKARQLEEEYANQGKELTIDEVVKIAKEHGAPDVLIDEIKHVYSESIKEAGNSPKASNPPIIPDSLSFSQSANNTTTINDNNINPATTQPTTFNNISISELAEAMGASDKLVEKARQFEELAAAQGKPITVTDLCNIAEALGYPHDVVQKIRDADAQALAEGRVMTLSELADVAEAAGVSPEKVAKLRQIIKERNLEDGYFTTNGLLPTNNSTLANNGTLTNAIPMNNSTVPLNNANNQNKDKSDEGGFNYWILIGIIVFIIIILFVIIFCFRSKK
jgi:transcriptional regulator with XRE-family HTH domain